MYTISNHNYPVLKKCKTSELITMFTPSKDKKQMVGMLK